MFHSSRLAFAWILLSLSSSAALAQSASNAYLDEEIRKRLEEIEKDISEINQLLKLRTAEPEMLTWDKLGITGTTASEAKLLKPYTGGVEITKMEPNSVAEAMALKVGDVLVQYDGSKTPTLDDLVAAIESSGSQGTRFPKILVVRDGRLFVTSRLAGLERKTFPFYGSEMR